MAKTVNLTVKVDDTDFKKFIKDFNAFVSQIGALNKNFQQVNTTIQKSQQSAKGVLDTIKSAISASSTLYSWTQKIGKSFMRWGTAIGGIVSMLTTGAGMFGIDRLAESIMQRRRQAMGLGTTRGGLLGAQIGGQTLFQDPSGVLAGIRTAMGGGPGAGALAGLGLFPSTQFGGDPARALPSFIRNLWSQLQRATPGTEVALGRALTEQQGLSGVTDQDIIRLRGLTRKEVEEEIARMEEIRKATEMTKEAQKGWAALQIQFLKAKSALESVFGERFKELTKPLERLSDAFVKLVEALLKSKTVTDIISWLTIQLNKLTSTLKEDPDAISKEIEKWDKYIEDEWMPLLKKLGDALTGFADVISKMEERWQDLVRFWKNPASYLWGKYGPGWGSTAPGTGGTTAPGGGAGMPGTPSGPSGGPAVPNRNIPQDLRDPMTGAPLPSPPASGTTPPVATTPPTPGTTFSPETNIPPWQRQREQRGSMFMPGNFVNQQFASVGGPAFGGTAFGGAGGSVFGVRGGNQSLMAGNLNQFGGRMNVGGGRSTAMGLAFGGSRGGDINIGDRTGGDINMRGGGRRTGMFASIRGGNRIAMFGGAARGRIPGNEMNQFGMRGGNLAIASADNRKFSRYAGPLDTDQWQMNRTTNLTIRNVPGSNIFAQATGMG